MTHLKKIILAVLFLAVLSPALQAQTFGEWFNQKNTQRKYLLEQIAAFQVYLGYLKKGYSIAHDGLHLIGDIKNGEFGLHKSYFDSLKTVNPKIMHSSKAAAILSLQAAVLEQIDQSLNKIAESGQFPANETGEIKGVYGKLLQECADDLEELSLVIKNGQTEMTDDKRIAAIDKTYASIQDKYAFLQTYCNHVTEIMQQRQQAKADIEVLRRLDGE